MVSWRRFLDHLHAQHYRQYSDATITTMHIHIMLPRLRYIIVAASPFPLCPPSGNSLNRHVAPYKQLLAWGHACPYIHVSSSYEHLPSFSHGQGLSLASFWRYAICPGFRPVIRQRMECADSGRGYSTHASGVRTRSFCCRILPLPSNAYPEISKKNPNQAQPLPNSLVTRPRRQIPQRPIPTGHRHRIIPRRIPARRPARRHPHLWRPLCLARS